MVRECGWGGGGLWCVSVFVRVCVWMEGGGEGGIEVRECICVRGWRAGGGGGIAVRDCICVRVGGWKGGGGLRCVSVFVCVCVDGGGGVHRSIVKPVKATTRIRRPPTLSDQGMLLIFQSTLDKAITW